MTREQIEDVRVLRELLGGAFGAGIKKISVIASAERIAALDALLVSVATQERQKCLHCKQVISSCNGEVCDVCAHRLGICHGCSACVATQEQTEKNLGADATAVDATGQAVPVNQLPHDGTSLESLRANVIGELDITDVADAAHAIGHIDALIRAVASHAFAAGWDSTKWVVCNASYEETQQSLRKQLLDSFYRYHDASLPPFATGSVSSLEPAVELGAQRKKTHLQIGTAESPEGADE